MEKYWCELCGVRTQVTKENCVQCDKDACMPKDSWYDCTARKPYVMPITEAIHGLKWWLKLLWTDTIEFPYYLVSELFKRLGQTWGFSIYIKDGKVVERKLHIGLKEA
jgi:hypothetical protein